MELSTYWNNATFGELVKITISLLKTTESLHFITNSLLNTTN